MIDSTAAGEASWAAQELEILRRAAHSLHESLMILERSGNILYVNPAFERMTGWSAAEALGKTPRILKSGAHPEDVYRELWSTVLSGRTWRGTLLNRRRNGNVFPQELIITPIAGPDGHVSHFVSAAVDVSERLQSAQEVVAKQEIFEQVLESLGDVAFLVDIPTRRFLYVSPMYERVSGYPGSEILEDTRAVLKPVHPDDVERVTALLDLEEFDGDKEIEYSIVRPDGEKRRVHVRAWLVRDVHGEPARFAGTLRDVTEARAKEEELEKKEALYRQSQKMEAVGRLAGGVAHDFNNMLTAILGYGEMLEEALEGQPALKGAIDEVVKAGRRAAELTKRLLAFSRKQVLAPESLDLGAVVKDVEGMLRRVIGEDVSLEVTVTSQIPRVHADRGQIEQVLLNLAVNARDAMPQGGKLRISISATSIGSPGAEGVPAAGTYVKLSVADTGSGMTDEVKSHLFEPFYTTKAQGQGTGLGLATVHGIVRQSGGGISVRSQPGQGTTFDVYLPVSKEAPRAAERPGSRARKEHRGSGTILVAEDEPLVRRLVVETLERAGYRVLEAHDGGEAMTMASAEPGPIRLLVTDVVMPSVGGPAAARSIQEARPGMKVLFLSGYTDETLADQLLGQAGTAFLQKPFAPKLLLQKVGEILADRETTGH